MKVESLETKTFEKNYERPIAIWWYEPTRKCSWQKQD